MLLQGQSVSDFLSKGRRDGMLGLDDIWKNEMVPIGVFYYIVSGGTLHGIEEVEIRYHSPSRCRWSGRI